MSDNRFMKLAEKLMRDPLIAWVMANPGLANYVTRHYRGWPAQRAALRAMGAPLGDAEAEHEMTHMHIQEPAARPVHDHGDDDEDEECDE